MKILILGGMHGNEMLGIRLVESLRREPIVGVDAVIANPRAVAAGERFVETDLNRSFGDQPDDTFERRRAKELSELIVQYDVVFDFHNTQTPDNNCCFTGVESELRLYQLATQLGFSQCVQATYDCINRYNSNVLSVEISVGDEQDSVSYWRRKFQQIQSSEESSERLPDVYRFTRRVTWREKDTYDLHGWRPFMSLSDYEATAFGVPAGSVPIFIGSRFTEYYATLLEPVPMTMLNLANNR